MTTLATAAIVEQVRAHMMRGGRPDVNVNRACLEDFETGDARDSQGQAECLHCFTGMQPGF
jgi:hypothetical protein